MTININLDVILAKRKMKSNELAKLVGITEQNLSILKTGKTRDYPHFHTGCHMQTS